MKRYILYIAAAVGLLATSCNDFLTEELQGDYSTKSFYKNPDNGIRAVNGIYNTVLFTSSENYLWVFGDVASDDAIKGGSAGDLSDANYIDDFTALADNGILNIYWQFTYEAIARANAAIAYIPGIPKIDPDLSSRLVGEAKFLRALSYFHLVNIWGSVPKRIQPNDATNGNISLSSVDEIYALIEQDLRDAAVSNISISYALKDKGRVTKGAAYGLLAKVHLFRERWGDCITDISILDTYNIYDLENNYADLFKVGAEESKEVLFAARHLTEQNPGLGNILNVYFSPSIENGYYFNAPTQSFVDAFNEKTTEDGTDPRLDASIGRPGQPWVNGDVFQADWSPTTYLVKKYDQPLTEVPIGRKSDGYLPYMYLRYADILLMKAEALAQRNTGTDFDDAKTTLDRVRSRAGLAGTTATTQAQLLDAIRLERRRELGFESHRFFDLMRWGRDIAVAALGQDIAAKWTGTERFYFPLPTGETDSNEGVDADEQL